MNPTDEEILDWLDPDWRMRWRGDVDRAAKHYQQWAEEDWQQAIKDLS